MPNPPQEPLLVSIISAPPKGVPDQGNELIGKITTLFRERGVPLLPAASVLAIDLHLEKLTDENPGKLLSVQLIGHAMSGQLYLGASWMPNNEIRSGPPFYILDTNPAALGLLSKYAGHLADLTLVGCDIGSTSSYGYAINGRTLTYTLAEVLQCPVRGADDQVSFDEFNDQGVYAPATIHRKPTGWKWSVENPPEWMPGSHGVPPVADTAIRKLKLIAVTNTRLPVPNRKLPRELPAPIKLSGRKLRDPHSHPRFALPEVTVVVQDADNSRHHAELLSGGRYLKLANDYYVIDQNAELSMGLTRCLWSRDPAYPQ